MDGMSYTITVGEIIDEFEKAKTRKDKKEVLERFQDIEVFRHLLRGTFDPKVQWTISEKPDYTAQDVPEGESPNTLYQEIPKCSIFVKGHPASAKLKMERAKQLLIQIMESLHPSEAELYMQMLKKKIEEWMKQDRWPGIYWQRNRELIDFDYIPSSLAQAIEKNYKLQTPPNRSGLLNYFVKHRLKMLIEHIGDF